MDNIQENLKPYEEWREKQRNQVSNVTSLYLALSTAILGFVVNYISKTQIISW